jgi:hypothetical protein
MTRNFQSLGITEAPELEVLSAGTRFAAVLRDSISAGMSRVIGVEGTQSMLYYIDLPGSDNPEKFHERLKEIFGSGTAALERVILQELYQMTGVSHASVNEGDFVNKVELARRMFEEAAARKGRP